MSDAVLLIVELFVQCALRYVWTFSDVLWTTTFVYVHLFYLGPDQPNIPDAGDAIVLDFIVFYEIFANYKVYSIKVSPPESHRVSWIRHCKDIYGTFFFEIMEFGGNCGLVPPGELVSLLRRILDVSMARHSNKKM